MMIGIDKGLKDTPRKDHRVKMEMTVDEARAIKKLIRIGLACIDTNYINPVEEESGREAVRSLEIII